MNEDDVSSEALLVTSVPLEELGVVVSSSSASGELTSGERVDVSGSSSDSVLVCVMISDDEALLVISIPLEVLDDVGVDVVASSSSASGELTSKERVVSSYDTMMVCNVVYGALLVISIPLEVLDDVGDDVVASSSSASGELTSEERVNISVSWSDTVLVCVVISGDDDVVSSEALLEISTTLEELDGVGVSVVVSSSITCGELSSVERVNVSVSSTDSVPVCKFVLLSSTFKVELDTADVSVVVSSIIA